VKKGKEEKRRKSEENHDINTFFFFLSFPLSLSLSPFFSNTEPKKNPPQQEWIDIDWGKDLAVQRERVAQSG